MENFTEAAVVLYVSLLSTSIVCRIVCVRVKTPFSVTNAMVYALKLRLPALLHTPWPGPRTAGKPKCRVRHRPSTVVSQQRKEWRPDWHMQVAILLRNLYHPGPLELQRLPAWNAARAQASSTSSP
jgi:hypothetical protein